MEILEAMEELPQDSDEEDPLVLDEEDPLVAGAGDIFLEGIENLPGAANQQPQVMNSFCGDAYQSRAHMEWLRAMKKMKKANCQAIQAQENLSVIATAWDGVVLREGDRLASGLSGQAGNRSNQTRVSGILRVAWQSVGKNVVERVGIAGTTRAHPIVATTCAVINSCQEGLMQAEMQTAQDSGQVPVVLRWYDATPFQVRFGQLQEQVMPHARYPVIDLQTKRWKTVPYSEYVRDHRGRGLPTVGVVDILVLGSKLLFMQENGELRGWRHFARPCALQHGGASCIYRGVEQGTPSFSAERLAELSQHIPF
eukprot:12398106-Karenia_brevis.AAC.1